MYIRNKTGISILLIVAILLLSELSLLTGLGIVKPAIAHAETTPQIGAGTYIQFGRYYGDPILWRVINKNDDGSLMLLSEKIICLKPFDAAGDKTDDFDRRSYGSNNWEKSNIREWLNSDSQTVAYTCQPPDNSHVFNGYNDYAEEAGFLYNFTQSERDMIQPVTHKSLLTSVDSNVKDGGTELHVWNSEVEEIVQNFDKSFYKNVTDKVFLLDVKEIHDYVFERGYEHKRMPTAKAANRSEYKIDSANYWYYWLRTPSGDNSQLVRFICNEGFSNSDNASNGDMGILPALNLKTEIKVSGGDGTEGNPYVVIGSNQAVHTAPQAFNVQIAGDPRTGNVLTGSYEYFDADGDGEAGTTYRWLMADTADGVFEPIPGETSVTYKVLQTDLNKYLKFEVIPKTSTAPQQGNLVESQPVRIMRSSNAKLAFIKVNNVSVKDFARDRLVYTVSIPGGTTQIPVIDAHPEDSRARVDIMPASSLPGSSKIQVTAEDGTIETYILNFELMQHFVESMHPYNDNMDQTWEYALPEEHSALQVTFSSLTEAEDGCDFIYVMDANGVQIPESPFTGTSLAGKTVRVPGNAVKIRLKSDTDENTFGFAVTYIKPELSLRSLKVNGTDIPQFDPLKLTYRYVLSKDTSHVPVVSAEGEAGSSVYISPAKNIPGETSVRVYDSNNILVKTYLIQFVYAGDIITGDYIQFGSYLGEPVNWRVINRNTDGSLMLLSDKILCLKPFDAKGDQSEEANRRNYGSNNWEKSNIREWLNSDSQAVKYTCQAPDSSHVFNGYNDYAEEAGFLQGFTEAERNLIMPVAHKSLLSSADIGTRDGGGEIHIWNSNIAEIVQNYNQAYYKNVTDKVFLLDVKELHDYVYARGFEYRKVPTAKAVNNSDHGSERLNSTDPWYYWLRTPSGDNSYMVRNVFSDGGYDFLYAYDGNMGIAPALNLRAEIITSGGDGSEGNPYLVMRDPATLRGDLDGDGIENIKDLIIFAKAYGSDSENVNGKWNEKADFNSDGRINFSDFEIMKQYFNR